ncbi:hypothetical protein D7X30_15685 [Corallococcus sp. AB011P]|uniref:hypothetical protein n=1 Tax=Corallococcus sp. AB011P TaxID=2316735 RepID=UPI000EA3CFC0|nr:hypothetical protein [Corallococcus sp. AB011P]RKG59000.1 hypothetical protein D7X30_15685 [Corallococcus sp. AB011P]
MRPSIHGKARAVSSSIPWLPGTCVWGLSLWLCLLPGAARGDVSPDVRLCAESIYLLIEDLEYERALEQLVRCQEGSRGPEDEVALSLYQGVILAELSGRLSDAEAAFKAALGLNPDAKLPLTVSPKVKRHFEAVRKRVLKEWAARGAASEPLTQESPSEAQEVQAPREPLPVITAGLPESSSSPVREVPGAHPSLRDRAMIPAVAGGALVVAAGVFWGVAEGRKSKLDGPAKDIHSLADARNVAHSARRLQTASVGLLVGGLVGLGASTGMYLLGSPKKPVPVQLGLDGTSVFVSGRWP